MAWSLSFIGIYNTFKPPASGQLHYQKGVCFREVYAYARLEFNICYMAATINITII